MLLTGPSVGLSDPRHSSHPGHGRRTNGSIFPLRLLSDGCHESSWFSRPNRGEDQYVRSHSNKQTRPAPSPLLISAIGV